VLEDADSIQIILGQIMRMIVWDDRPRSPTSRMHPQNKAGR
jgi:hypothetical protein